jgi:hypothetical protein
MFGSGLEYKDSSQPIVTLLVTQTLSEGRGSERDSYHSRRTVQLSPCVDLSADGNVGDEPLVLQPLACVGRGAVLLEPVLDVLAVVRVAVGGNDGVVHQNALEHHILQFLCKRA